MRLAVVLIFRGIIVAFARALGGEAPAYHLHSAVGITKVAFSAIPAGLDTRVGRLPRLESRGYCRSSPRDFYQSHRVIGIRPVSV
jgi:hypothetical protein